MRWPNQDFLTGILVLICTAGTTVHAAETGTAIMRRGGCGSGLRFYPGFHSGFNHLVRNYEGYGSLWLAGLDLNLLTSTRNRGNDSACSDRIMLRLSMDYAPLKVPDGNYGLSEQIVNPYFSVVYRFGSPLMSRLNAWTPFVGAGAGAVFDMVKLDTPATGAASGTATLFDISVTGGVLGPELFEAVRFTPEVRVHLTGVPNGWALNAVYMVGLTYAPQGDGGPILERKRRARRTQMD
jgi:hypothetical protein